jgi:type VI protein secretion system component Hcp
MACNNFMVLVQQDGNICLSGSLLVSVAFADPFPDRPKIKAVPQSVFEIIDYSWQVQLPATGTQSTSGKATFAPLRLTKRVDNISPALFDMCMSGTKFKYVDFLQQQNPGSDSSELSSAYGLGAVTVRSISYSVTAGEEAPQETVVLEYEALSIGYAPLDSKGKREPFLIKTWNQVHNARV